MEIYMRTIRLLTREPTKTRRDYMWLAHDAKRGKTRASEPLLNGWKGGAIFLGHSCSVVITTARAGLLCTCKPKIDSRVSVPCLLWLLLILAVCFPRPLLFSHASLESAWPLRRCTIVMTPLKAASHLPFHKIPVIAKLESVKICS